MGRNSASQKRLMHGKESALQNYWRTIHNNHNLIRLCLAAFVLIAVCNILLIYSYYRDYQEKKTIICTMLTNDTQTDRNGNSEQALLAATSLLKGEFKQDSYKSGLLKLQSYGYFTNNNNALFLEFCKRSRVTLGIAMILYILFCTVLMYLKKLDNKIKSLQFIQIEQTLTNFQNHRYEMPDTLASYIEDEPFGRILMQLSSLSSFLKLNEQTLHTEKEATKSLVSDISHQLKTPVAALRTCYEILTSSELTESERIEFSDRCIRQLNGLENLVAALIQISRMETGIIHIQKEEQPIFNTLLNAVNRVYTKADSKNISIELDEEPQIQNLQIAHDAKWTCEAFINILENAIKYSPKNSSIQIHMYLLTSYLRIEFEDHGIGIPTEEFHKVFQRFYRGSSAEVHSQEGSGIGLYLTREILEQQQGSITVASNQPKGCIGTTFIIQLPIN